MRQFVLTFHANEPLTTISEDLPLNWIFAILIAQIFGDFEIFETSPVDNIVIIVKCRVPKSPMFHF